MWPHPHIRYIPDAIDAGARGAASHDDVRHEPNLDVRDRCGCDRRSVVGRHLLAQLGDGVRIRPRLDPDARQACGVPAVPTLHDFLRHVIITLELLPRLVDVAEAAIPVASAPSTRFGEQITVYTSTAHWRALQDALTALEGRAKAMAVLKDRAP